MLNQIKISRFLQDPVTVHLYDSIDSTNNEAKRRAAADRGIHLYASTCQTAGRGRNGHSFYSPKDTGLYMTLALPLEGAPAAVQRITCAAGVAVCNAVTSLSGKHPQIKWVNDIFLDGKKTAGVLTELLTDSSNKPHAVIVGIGLNLCTEDFPDAFAANAGNLGVMDVNALCGTIAANLIELYRDLDHHSMIKKYKQLNLCIGRTVTYEKDGAVHTATAVDIAPDGGLVVEEHGERTVLNSGEISVKM